MRVFAGLMTNPALTTACSSLSPTSHLCALPARRLAMLAGKSGLFVENVMSSAYRE
jgi:hypothetical protein